MFIIISGIPEPCLRYTGENLNYYQDVKKYYIFTYFLGDSEGSGSGWNGILFDDEESDMSQSLGRFKL